MQIEELIDLTNWIERSLKEKQLPELYEALHKVLKQNTQPNQRQQPFETQRDQLLQALNTTPTTELSHGQIEVLKSLDIWDNIGRTGAEGLEDTLYRNALDIATAAKDVNSTLQKLKKALDWSNQVNDLLNQITDADDVLEDEGFALMRVHFSGNAQISNLSHFKEWGKVWYDIGRGIAMANHTAPEDIRIVGASKGSVILTLIGTYVVVRTVSLIILELLKVSEKYFQVKRMAEEAREKKLKNDRIVKLLEEEADSLREDGISEIVEKVKESCNLETKKNGEEIEAIKRSIEKLSVFIDQGGDVDIVMPEDSQDDEDESDKKSQDEKEKIRDMLKEIRALESTVRQIEHKP